MTDRQQDSRFSFENLWEAQAIIELIDDRLQAGDWENAPDELERIQFALHVARQRLDQAAPSLCELASKAPEIRGA